MSLINQMLRDLEERRSENAQPSSFVRPLPTERHTPWSRIATGIIVAGLLVAGIILWLRAAEQAQLLAVAVPTPAAVAPSSSMTLPSGAVPARVASNKAGVALKKSDTESSPRPSALTSVGVNSPVASVSATSPAKPLPSRFVASADVRLKVATSLSLPSDTASTVVAKAAPTAAMPPAPRTGEGSPSIEKQLRLPTAGDRAENEYRKAVALLNQGRLGDAIAGLRATLQEDANHLNARLTLVGVLVEQKKLDEAQALLQEPLNANPTQPQLALRLAHIQVERGDSRAAADTLQKAGAANGNAEFHGYYAAVLQRLNRHKDAIEEYKTALRLVPSGLWWMGLGISLEADGRAADAREAFQRARATGSLSAELDRFVEQKLKATE